MVDMGFSRTWHILKHYHFYENQLIVTKFYDLCSREAILQIKIAARSVRKGITLNPGVEGPGQAIWQIFEKRPYTKSYGWYPLIVEFP